MEKVILIAAVVLLSLAVLALLLYLFTLRRSLREIREQMGEKLETDTNTLLSISTGDPQVRALAVELNQQLRALREERLRLRHGDLELKEAVTNISHDLRTPLTAICGYLDLLEREEQSETARRYAAVIRERADSLAALTEELFRYSVIASSEGELALESVDLRGALEESLAAFYGALTSRGIQPQVSLPQSPVRRDLDPAALRRVLGNLLNNALKYSDGDLSVSLSQDGTISFSNSAREMTAVQAEKLFDRFYTVETARNSTGLGLSIAKLLTERMGGEIGARYQEGRLFLFLSFPDKKEQEQTGRRA